jgi:hypothetical protein
MPSFAMTKAPAILALMLAGLPLAPAAARVETYSGFVIRPQNSNGLFDSTGLFGFERIDERPFTLTFRYDPAAAPYLSADSQRVVISGGSFNHLPAFGRATLKIGAHAVTLRGLVDFGIYYQNIGSGSDANSSITQDGYNYFTAAASYQGNYTITGQPYSASLLQPLNLNTVGIYRPRALDPFGPDPQQAGPRPNGSFRLGYGFSGSLNITQVAYSNAATVPEPASWAMLLAGFGWVGATMRHSRRWRQRA